MMIYGGRTAQIVPVLGVRQAEGPHAEELQFPVQIADRLVDRGAYAGGIFPDITVTGRILLGTFCRSDFGGGNEEK